MAVLPINSQETRITMPSTPACGPVYDNQQKIDLLNGLLANLNMLKNAGGMTCDQKFIDQVTKALNNELLNGRIINNTCQTPAPTPANNFTVGGWTPTPPTPSEITQSAGGGGNYKNQALLLPTIPNEIGGPVVPPNPPTKVKACQDALDDYSSNLTGIILREGRGEITSSEAVSLSSEALSQCAESCGEDKCKKGKGSAIPTSTIINGSISAQTFVSPMTGAQVTFEQNVVDAYKKFMNANSVVFLNSLKDGSNPLFNKTTPGNYIVTSPVNNSPVNYATSIIQSYIQNQDNMGCGNVTPVATPTNNPAGKGHKGGLTQGPVVSQGADVQILWKPI